MQQFSQLAAMGISAKDYSSLPSTNEFAKQRLVNGATAPFLVSAQRQTAGHGKLTRQFYSPAGSGAYFTLALTIQPSNALMGHLTVTAAVAAYEVLTAYFGQSLAIKWVNDLYVNGRKAVGILAEAALNRRNQFCGVVLGWGINLAVPPDLPAELRSRVGWLRTGAVTDQERLLIIERVAARFWTLLNHHSWARVLQVYCDHQLLAGKQVSVDTGSERVIGCFDHLSAEGYLCLQTEQGMRTFAAGTVRESITRHN